MHLVTAERFSLQPSTSRDAASREKSGRRAEHKVRRIPVDPDPKVSARTYIVVVLGLAAGCGRFGYDPEALEIDASVAGPDTSYIDADVGADGDPLADAAPPSDAGPDADPCPGCPTGIALVGPVSSTPQIGGTGGTAFAESCPAGQVIIGYQGGRPATFNFMGSFRALCGTVSIAPGTVTVTMSATTQLPLRGMSTDKPWSAPCPADMLVVGFGGRCGQFFDEVIFRCAPLVISGGPGAYTIATGNVVLVTAVTGPGGQPFAEQLCAGGRVATGDFGREGLYIDAFGLQCRRPQLVF